MSRERRLRAYPVEDYVALFKEVGRSGEVVLEMETKKALSLRAELQAFVRVCLKNPAEARDCGVDLQDVYDVRTRVRDGALVLYHRRQAIGTSEIAQALAKKGITVPVARPGVQAPPGGLADEIFDPEASLARVLAAAQKGGK